MSLANERIKERVPILSRPEGPELRSWCFYVALRSNVPILSQARRPGATGNPPKMMAMVVCSNPLQARRPGATVIITLGVSAFLPFQSSPGPKARSYELTSYKCRDSQVPILSRPEGPELRQ